MTCVCRDIERLEAFEAQQKRNAGQPWFSRSYKKEPDPIKLADFVQKSERDYRVRFDPEFYVPSECPYATEQLFIQDDKGLIK